MEAHVEPHAPKLQPSALPAPERAPRKDFGRTPKPADQPQWPGTPGAPNAPSAPSAPAGAPNTLLILTDDIGYAASSTFGGPIPCPTLDALAKQGLRYTEFHTTAMCSPTRAALMTGRNLPDVGSGRVTAASSAYDGYDGYDGIIPKSAAAIAEVLRLNGCSRSLVGKYHNVPGWESGPADPFDR